MDYRELLFGNRLLALLLAVDGVLNAVLFSDLLFAIPFLLAAAEFFFTPDDWQYAKWLVLFSLVAGIGSLLSSLSILIDGVMHTTPFTIAEGAVLSGRDDHRAARPSGQPLPPKPPQLEKKPTLNAIIVEQFSILYKLFA
jgi:hypothetical protein